MLASGQVVLPFAVSAGNRGESFSVEAELAAVFALSELERKNSGLGSKQERCVFILKVGYPLWFVARDGFTHVFDGLNMNSYSWACYEKGHVKFELGNLEGLFRIREKYTEFLVNYNKNFCQLQNCKELICEGLIADKTLLGELDSYRREAIDICDQPLGLLLPVLEEKKVTDIVNQMETWQRVFREETEKLRQLSKLISKTTEGYMEGFSFELRAIVEEVEAKIKAQKEVINPKIEKLTREYKKQVERLEKSVDKEKQPIVKQKVRIEKSIKETEKIIERYIRQVKSQAQKGNKRLEDSLKKKLGKEKQKMGELQKQHKKIASQLEELVTQETEESFRLKSNFTREVEIERQPITALEVFREGKQEFFKQERLKLEELTRLVLEELGRLIVEREKFSASRELLGFKTDTMLNSNIRVHVPFYIATYVRGDAMARRYFVFSPSVVGSLGFSSKLKGVLGRAKIRDLFNDRFVAVSSLGKKLQVEMSSNRELAEQLEGLAQKKNILDMKSTLRGGLCLLKEEGWFSESEYQTFLSGV